MSEKNIPYNTYLTEDEMPRAWYNLRADMKVKPAPLLNPGTGAPMKAAELENEERRGNLHRTEDIEKGLSALCLNMRGRFSGLPAKLSGELSQMGGNQAGIHDKLKAAIDETLEELSRFHIAFAVSGGEDEEDDEPM